MAKIKIWWFIIKLNIIIKFFKNICSLFILGYSVLDLYLKSTRNPVGLLLLGGREWGLFKARRRGHRCLLERLLLAWAHHWRRHFVGSWHAASTTTGWRHLRKLRGLLLLEAFLAGSWSPQTSTNSSKG